MKLARRTHGQETLSTSSLAPTEFRSLDEIDGAITNLERRIQELQQLDIPAAVLKDTEADDVAQSNVRAAIREVFGQNSPEFREHEKTRLVPISTQRLRAVLEWLHIDADGQQKPDETLVFSNEIIHEERSNTR